MRRLVIGTFVITFGFSVAMTQGCGDTTGPGADSGTGGTKDAGGAGADAPGAAGSTGGADAQAGTNGDAGADGGAGAGGHAGASGGAGSGPSLCGTVCVHADACCNAVNVLYDNGVDNCSYAMSCTISQGATSDDCKLYLQRLPMLLLPSMPLPDACKSATDAGAAQ